MCVCVHCNRKRIFFYHLFTIPRNHEFLLQISFRSNIATSLNLWIERISNRSFSIGEAARDEMSLLAFFLGIGILSFFRSPILFNPCDLILPLLYLLTGKHYIQPNITFSSMNRTFDLLSRKRCD